MKQTAVEWLIEQIIKYRLVTEGTNPDNVLFHKAKAMEEQNYLDLIRFLRTQDKMGKSVEDLLEQFKRK